MSDPKISAVHREQAAKRAMFFDPRSAASMGHGAARGNARAAIPAARI